MGRRRRVNPLGLPPRLQVKHGAFWYVSRGKWDRLGTDLKAAVAEAVRRNSGRGFGTMAWWYSEFLIHCQRRVGRPKSQRGLAPRTVDDYRDAEAKLMQIFGHMTAAAILPEHVGKYLERGAIEGRAVRANREKAALSACFTWLMLQTGSGVTLNPCRGVKRNPEFKRGLYVEDAHYQAVAAKATRSGRVMMGLVYRTLQRPEDVLGWRTGRNLQRRGEQLVLRIQQNKTGKWLEIEVSPEIDELLPGRGSSVVRLDEPFVQRRDGDRYTKSGLDSMLRRWCKKAGVPSFGFGDLKGKGATDMYHDGVSINLIRDLCGHESTRTTEIYIKSRTRSVIAPNRRAIKSLSLTRTTG